MFCRVFVTVGTTEFDELIDVIGSAAFCDVLTAEGCSQLTIQVWC